MDSELQRLAQAYVENKRELDSYTKLCKMENEEIKKMMSDEGVEEVDVGGGKALRRTITDSYDVNELKMLQVLKRYGVPAVKTVEVIDEDALEKFLYNADPNEHRALLQELDGCKKLKQVVSLRVVNAKKQED